MTTETKIPEQAETVEGFRLSPQQEHLWRLMPDGAVHPFVSRCRVEIAGALDPAALAEALDDIAGRHEIARTLFRRLPGMLRPLQVVTSGSGLRLAVEDLGGVPDEERAGQLGRILAGLAGTPFDLERGPLARALLVRLGPDRHLLEIVVPALCADRAGLTNLVREIARAYAHRAGAGTAEEEPVQYADAAEIFHDLLTSPDTAKGRDYWLRQDLPPAGAPVLPGGRADGTPFAPALVTSLLPAELAASVSSLAAREGLPVPAFFLSCFGLLLGRLTEVRRPVLGLACDGRTYEDLRESPGLFARHVPVRLDLGEEEAFRDLWRRTTEEMAEAERRQDFFSWELRVPEGEAAWFPFGFEMVGVEAPVQAGGATFRILERQACIDRFQVELCCAASEAGLAAELHYDAAIYAASDIELLAERLQALVAGAVAAPGAALQELEILGASERRRLLADFNDTRVEHPAVRLHDLFTRQADETPDRVAVEWEHGAVTYGELAPRARRLAARLRRLGVGPDARVAICGERSPELLAGLLGILEAGGAYVPLDPGLPRERLARVLEGSRPAVLLAESRLLPDLPTGGAAPLALEEDLAGEEPGSQESAAGPADLAYVIYTSGSTGEPKGVMVSHGAIANRVLWMRRALPLEPWDAVALKTPFGFDASIWEMFLPLSCGARLVLARPGGHRDAAYLAELVARTGVTVLQLVPSMLGVFLEEPGAPACAGLRRMFCGGEALTAELRQRFFARLGWAELHNLYGPTECAIDATHWPCRPEAGEANVADVAAGAVVPLGRPIDNDRVYVLGPGLRPLPEGLAGELCVGGAGLARGYLGRPDLTAERFVPDPLSGEPGARLYRTGDLVRHLPGGALGFLGRIDHQVKLRGFRIELGEIEATLDRCPGVVQGVVMLREDEPGNPRLVAYAVARPGEEPPPAGLRAFLAERLPDYMVPAACVLLEALPRLPNGKVDRAALPAPAALRADEAAAEAPRTPVEQMLAGIWTEVLAVERLGPRDDFFALGGHSLLATQLVSRLRRTFGVELPLRAIFESPTVESLGARIEVLRRGGQPAAPPIEPARREGPLPLSFAQQRLWFLYQLQPDSPFYNVPVAVRLAGRLDLPALARSLSEVVRRHAALRTTFHEGADGEPFQVPGEPVPLALPVIDLDALPTARREAESWRLTAAETARPFDLRTGPLLRACLLRLGAAEHAGLLTMHHIASDGWSTGVLIREVGALYRAFALGEPSPLPELPLQYADFAVWQRHWLQGEVLEAQLAYWTGVLAGAPRVLELPTDFPRPAVQSFRGAVESRQMGAEIAAALHGLARRHGTTLFMALVAAGQALLRWWTGQDDVVVGTDVANRNRGETEGLIGFFINQMALRTRLDGDPTFEQVLERVREVTLGAYAHEDLPFDRLVMALNPERSRSHSPLFQVKVNLHNLPAPALELPGLVLEPLRVARDSAQFDLILNFVEGPDGLAVSADYATDLFEGRTIARLLAALETLLEHAVAHPEARLSELDEALSRAARERRLSEQQERLEALRQGPQRAEAIQGFRLSPQQARVWRLLQSGEAAPYQTRCAIRLQGELDELALAAALAGVVERYEILRTEFRLLPGMAEPLQVITSKGPRWAGRRDLSGLAAEARETALEELWRAAATARGAFGSLAAALARTTGGAAGEHRLLLELSPLCADGPTLDRLAREIAAAYAAQQGAAAATGEALQYADVAEWLHALLESEEARDDLAYWQSVDLAEARDLELPFATPAADRAFGPRAVTLSLTGAGAAEAPAAFWLACWSVLLGRLTGRSALPVGVVLDGRPYEELREALGPLARVVPVRCEMPGDAPFSRIREGIGEALAEAAARQNGFSWERDGAGDLPLFPAAGFELVDLPPVLEAGGLGFALEARRDLREPFGLQLVCVRRAGRVDLELRYDAGRLRPEDAGRLARCLETLVASALERPESEIQDLDLLPAEEERRVVAELNRTAEELPGAGLLHGPFERQACQTPGRVALRFDGGTLTYAELDAWAERLARRLGALGVGPETAVALCVERSPAMVAGLLGILKAGGAYVPLDPEHPAERRAAILAEVAPPVLVTERGLAGSLASTGVPLLLLDEAWPEGGEDGAAGLPVRPEHLAYILYTSGSTGRPKGVMVPHRAISNRVLWMQRDYPLGESDRVLHKTPYGFDASIWEIFLPLSVGAEVVLARPGGHQDMAYLAATAAAQEITTLQLVPSLLRAFLDEPGAAACRGLRRMFCGGEELATDLAVRFSALLPAAALHNLYGPTETAIDATSWPCREGVGRRSVPIGRPIANVRAFVLDARLRPVPAGVAGELCVGGIGLARGYRERPDQTAERFVPDPFGAEPGARLYRTGDLARHLPGGELEYLGRLDRQVKLRGVRIEPREIEALLREHAGVRDAVVTVRGEGMQARLVAHVAAGHAGHAGQRREVEPRELRDFLRGRLPEAMVPAAVVVLESLPLTPNGKLDLRALPEPGAVTEGAGGPVAPRTETEALLAGFWSEVLGAEQVGVHDNFFDLGGHSLSATQLISRVRKSLKVELGVQELFAAPTVAGLAQAVEAAVRGRQAPPVPGIEPAPVQGELPLSFAQQRLWFLYRMQPDSSFYNLPMAVRFTGRLDVAALERSLGEIVRRHAALRTTFREREDGDAVQCARPPAALVLPVVDLEGLPEAVRSAEMDRLASAEASAPFDLATGPLFRATLLRAAADVHTGLLTMHHITSDGWSTAILVREMGVLYRAVISGQPSPLPELPLQYTDFAYWQRRWLAGEVLDEQLAYWTERLRGAPQLLGLPTDFPRPTVQSFRGASLARHMSAGLGEAVKALARRHEATLFMTVIAAGATLLHWWSGQDDVVVGTDVANRNRGETEGLIGFFINQLALRTRVSGEATFAEVLDQVRGVTLGAYAHEDLPFDRLVTALNPERSRSHAPLFQVKVNLHNLPAPDLDLPGLAAEPLYVARNTAQFDLILNVMDTASGLVVGADYATDLFRRRTIERLLAHLELLLETLARDPEARVAELGELLSKADREMRQSEQQERLESFRQTLPVPEAPAAAPPAPASAAIEGFRLSPQQSRIWRLLQGGERPFLARCAVRIEGDLDETALRAAVAEVVARHEILRTDFQLLPGMAEPLQVITAEEPRWLGAHDFTEIEAAARETALTVIWNALRAGGRGLRAALALMAGGERWLLLELAPLSGDGPTLLHVMRAVAAAYGARRGGPAVAEEPLQYADISEWFHGLLEAEEAREEAAYWQAMDLAAARDLVLPFEAAAPDRPFEPRMVSLAAAAPAVVPGSFWLACWAVLLGRLGGWDEVPVAVAREGRLYAELQSALGPLERWIPVRLAVPAAEPFGRVRERIAEALAEAAARQNSFTWERDEPAELLFPAACFEEVDLSARHEAGGARFSMAWRRTCLERFKLKLVALRRDDGVDLELHYDGSRFAAEDARRLARCLEALAAAAVTESTVGTAVADLDLLPAEEGRRVLVDFNRTAADLPGAGLLHGPFERQARQTPGRVALRCGSETLTYAELDERAELLARRLRTFGVGPEVAVALCLERSQALVVGLLGILKAGGAYVPLDPEHPAERRAAVLAEVEPPVLVTERRLAGDLEGAGTPLLCLDEPWEESGAGSVAAPVRPEHLAYVLYTSGSTGRPKGVMVPHRAISNRVLWMQRDYPLGEGDRVLHKTPYGFDASIWEIFLPLSIGAEVVLARPGGHQDMAYLAEAVVSHGITTLQLVPSLLRAFLEEPGAAACRGLRRMFCGGEELTADLAARFSALLPADLHNLYGPTETAIDATSWSCRDGVGRRSVPIGRPIANVRVFVLDAGLRPVPQGIAGELCVGGIGLARGYWGRPDQTAERFVPDPYGGEPGARLYRTGDLARHAPGGELEYLGRLDRQVKLRGVRIEPREIEALLREHGGVRDAVVMVRGEGTQARLVAYVVGRERGGVEPPVLRDFLRGRLPEAMVPAAVVVLDSLPLTPNGKLDAAALPDPESAVLDRSRGYVAPRSQTEALLADLWSEVLGAPRVGVHDDFFALGGHSLSATQLISRVRKSLGVDLAIHRLFDAPTVGALAAEVEAAVRGGAPGLPPVTPASRAAEMPLSFAQQRLWFFERMMPGTATFNILVGLRLSGSLDLPVLERALSEVVRRHESLRTTFPDSNGLPVQVVGDSWPVRLPVADLSSLPEPVREAEARLLVTAEGERPFDLARGPLLRVLLLRLGAGEHAAAVTVHHIVGDAWSSGVLTREVAALYRAFAAGEPSPLPELPVQYADFAAWQQRWLAGEALAAQTAWWLRQLEGAPPRLNLPADHARPEMPTYRGATLPVALPAELSEAVRALGRQHGATLFMTLLAAWKLLLHVLSGHSDVVVGTDVANRNRLETEGLVGFFINQLVLRTDLSGDPSFVELLARVRAVTLGAYAHQDTPFEHLVDALRLQRDLRYAPLFQVKFFLENTPQEALELPGLTMSPLPYDVNVAKLDLTLAFWERPEGLTGWINYSTDLFEAPRVKRMMRRFSSVLEIVAARPDTRLSQIVRELAAIDDQEVEAQAVELRDLKRKTFKAVTPKMVAAPATGAAAPATPDSGQS